MSGVGLQIMTRIINVSGLGLVIARYIYASTRHEYDTTTRIATPSRNIMVDVVEDRQRRKHL